MRQRPNIVLIMVDDMGFSDIGCYGSEIETPNLDRLAKNGLCFTQFYNTARCCPTRASLLTGLYPHQAGIGYMTKDLKKPGYTGYLSDCCVTIAEALKPAGYHTLMTGKWHVGGKRGHWPLDRGFDRFYGIPEGAGHYFRIKKGRTLLIGDTAIEAPEKWYATDAWTDYAIEFVEESVHKDKHQPFFLYVAHNAPHWPLHALPEDIEKYRGTYMKGWDELRKKRYHRQVEMGIIEKKCQLTPRDDEVYSWEDLSPEKKDTMDLKMAIYAAQIHRMDWNVGRLVARFEQLNILDNTLILFLSDNGGCAENSIWGFDRGKGSIGAPDSYSSYGRSWANLSDTPFRRFKHWVHEGGIATPLIAHWPEGITRNGALTDHPGHVIDVMATCCDVADAIYPATHNGHDVLPLEGKSLLPIFKGKKPEDRDILFWEHEGNRAVRKGKWKLVAVHSEEWELYDMEADRTELNDLSGSRPDIVRELSERYEAYATRCFVEPWDKVNPKGKKKKKAEDKK